MTRHARLLIGVFTASAAAITAAQAQNTSASQIIERCGTLGPIAIGNDVNAAMKSGRITLRQRADIVWETDDKSIRVATDRAGRVTDIMTSRKGTFTQRYIVIGDSRLDDVVQRYGSPRDTAVGPSTSSEGSFSVIYNREGITFTVRDTRGTRPPPGETFDRTIKALARQPVMAIRLHEKRADATGRAVPCDRKS